MEYFLIIALLLIILTPVFIYALDISSVSIRTARAREVVDSLAIAADNICGLGGGRVTVDVIIPYGAEYYRIGSNAIKLGIKIGDGVGEALAVTLCNVSGDIPLDEGFADIPVTMLDNGTIMIGGP